MTTYSAPTDTEINTDKPVKPSIDRRLRDNLLSAFEGDATAVAAGVVLEEEAIADFGVTAGDNYIEVSATTGFQTTTTNTDELVIVSTGTYRFKVDHEKVTVGGESQPRILLDGAVAWTGTNRGSVGDYTETTDLSVSAGQLVRFQMLENSALGTGGSKVTGFVGLSAKSANGRGFVACRQLPDIGF